MRKTISMIMIFVFGVSLWADVSELNNERKVQAAIEKAKGPYLRDNTDSNNRDATYTVDIYDSWGDGWNGASLDVIVNGVVVLSGLTLETGSYATFDLAPISVGDVIATAWTSGSYDSECYYYIYNDNCGWSNQINRLWSFYNKMGIIFWFFTSFESSRMGNVF